MRLRLAPPAAPSRRSRPTRQLRSRTAARRRLAAATWSAPGDGLVHGFLDLDVTEAETWCAERGVTLAHLVGCGLGRALAAVPDARSRVVAGRVLERPAADVSFTVAVQHGADLRAVCVRGIDGKHPRSVAAEVQGGARRILRGHDPQLGRAVALAGWLPGTLLRPAMAVAGFLANGLGLRLPGARIEAHAFGSALVTAVDVLGLARGLAPLLPVARVSTVACVGAPAARLQREPGTGRILDRRILEVGLTFDHRLVDGAQIGMLAQVLRPVVERPWEAWPEVRPAVAAARPDASAEAGARAV